MKATVHPAIVAPPMLVLGLHVMVNSVHLNLILAESGPKSQ
jgi:hypothetical protein